MEQVLLKLQFMVLLLKNVLNIELDCEETIDLNKITEASTIINQLIDKEENILKENDIDEVDIYSKEKGGEDE